MFVLIAALLSSSFISSISLAAGFTGGNQSVSTNIYGELTVICHNYRGGTDIHRESCYSNTLQPYEFDRFIPEQEDSKLDFDKVEISRIKKSGKMTKQSRSYSKEKQQTEHFNLWIATLFQRPLLDIGDNSLTYKLLKNGKTVKEGDFGVAVLEGKPRQCFHETIQLNGNGCPSGGQDLCENYFRRQNYCQ
jgi:hypothetical protein